MLNYSKLTDAAKKRGLSLAFLSSQIGMNRNYLINSRAQKTDVPADRIAKLASLLGVTPEYLTDHAETPTEESADVLQDVLDILRYRPECKILFSTLRKASAEDVLKAAKIIDALRDE